MSEQHKIDDLELRGGKPCLDGVTARIAAIETEYADTITRAVPKPDKERQWCGTKQRFDEVPILRAG